MLPTIAATSAAYLIGCLSPSYYLVRWRCGRDLRAVGSGKLGAFNTARLLGWRGFLIVLLADVLKGALAVGLAQALGLGAAGQMLALVAVVVGHDFPAQLGFRGGNGIAAAGGGLLAYSPALALTLAIIFGATLPALLLLRLVRVPVKVYTPIKLTIIAAAPTAHLVGQPPAVVLALAAVTLLVLGTVGVPSSPGPFSATRAEKG